MSEETTINFTDQELAWIKKILLNITIAEVDLKDIKVAFKTTSLLKKYFYGKVAVELEALNS